METRYDLIVIGGGPAGASAAIYAVRGGLSVAVVDAGGSALLRAERIENYYGGAGGGGELYRAGLEQAKSLGVRIINAQVVSAQLEDCFSFDTTAGTLFSRGAVIATGASRLRPDIPGLIELEGRGVSYCAVCDAFFYRKKRVGVIGSGSFALHEYETLKRTCEKAYLLTDGKTAEFDCTDIIDKKIKAITQANGRVSGVAFFDGSELALDGVFVALGVMGGGALAKTLGIATGGGNIKTDGCGRTNIPRLYAAGDCTAGIKQVARAVADGMNVGLTAVKELKKNDGA